MAVLNAPPKTKIGGNAMKKVEITKSCSGVRFAFQQGEGRAQTKEQNAQHITTQSAAKLTLQ